MEALIDHKEFTLIWVNEDKDGFYTVVNPKNLIGMNRDKAIGSLKLTKKIMSRKDCFIYDSKWYHNHIPLEAGRELLNG